MNATRLPLSSALFPSLVRRLPLPTFPVLALVGVSVLGASVPGCTPSQCDAIMGGVSAAAAGINGVVGAIKALETGPTSCNDSDPDLSTASFEGGSFKICDMSGKCSTTPAASLCEASPKDSSCNWCVKSKCCAEVPAFAGETIAGCLVACQSGLKDCGGTDIDTATAYCNGGPDAAYYAMGACVTFRCSSECSTFASVW